MIQDPADLPGYGYGAQVKLLAWVVLPVPV